MLSYGLECPCHGVRRFATAADRDAAAITYQCKARFFRVRYPDDRQAEKTFS